MDILTQRLLFSHFLPNLSGVYTLTPLFIFLPISYFSSLSFSSSLFISLLHPTSLLFASKIQTIQTVNCFTHGEYIHIQK